MPLDFQRTPWVLRFLRFLRFLRVPRGLPNNLGSHSETPGSYPLSNIVAVVNSLKGSKYPHSRPTRGIRQKEAQGVLGLDAISM